MKKLILMQFYVLLGGTVFAWYNFFKELTGSSSCVSCSQGSLDKLFTPCFGGAIFFTIAFILNLILLKNKNK